MRAAPILILSILACGGAAGCVERMMTIESDPPGALVYMNGQEVGRTPLTRDFKWYGNYDVVVRADGYETLKTETNIRAPWWQWVPFDLFAELLPLSFEDHQHRTYALTPASTQPVDAAQLLDRAEELRGQLESSRFRPPTTQP